MITAHQVAALHIQIQRFINGNGPLGIFKDILDQPVVYAKPTVGNLDIGFINFG